MGADSIIRPGFCQAQQALPQKMYPKYHGSRWFVSQLRLCGSVNAGVTGFLFPGDLLFSCWDWPARCCGSLCESAAIYGDHWTDPAALAVNSESIREQAASTASRIQWRPYGNIG
jgi:hypothetical protein